MKKNRNWLCWIISLKEFMLGNYYVIGMFSLYLLTVFWLSFVEEKEEIKCNNIEYYQSTSSSIWKDYPNCSISMKCWDNVFESLISSMILDGKSNPYDNKRWDYIYQEMMNHIDFYYDDEQYGEIMYQLNKRLLNLCREDFEIFYSLKQYQGSNRERNYTR